MIGIFPIIVNIYIVGRVAMANVNKPKPNVDQKGWYQILNTKTKWHYFNNSTTSECGLLTVIAHSSHFHDELHYHEDNCKNCMRSRENLFGKAEL